MNFAPVMHTCSNTRRSRTGNLLNCFSQFRTVLVLLLIGLFGGVLHAEDTPKHPFLHPLFCDHAVLERDAAVPVWGWTEPGTRVTVQFGGQTHTAMAAPDGRWEVKLDPMKVSAEPRSLKVTNETTHESATAGDVLVGDVWLCSGQSNMEMGVGLCNSPQDIATADFPQIRLLTVPHAIEKEPQDTLQCQWLPCSPETILQGQWGGFSAAAFFFGRDLYRELNIPIGLIHSSWGGTVAEAWTSAEGLEPLGDFNEALARLHDSAQGEKKPDYSEIYDAWCEKKDPGSQQDWQETPGAAAEWKSVKLPGLWEDSGLPGFDGMVWFRHTFELPAGWRGKDLKLDLGPIDDFDTTWVNGVKVGQMNRWDLVRRYTIPAKALKAGENVITVRVLDTGGGGGIYGQPEQLRLAPEEDEDASPLSLAGMWQMRESAPLSKLSMPPQPPNSNNPNVVTVLYNGMIAPLLPYAIKGAIWYQGEANANRAWQYRRLLPAMIRDWRNRFQEGDFPFYIVQLAAWQATNAVPRDNDWAELREAQALTARTIPNSGLAVTIDIGNANDIHPKDKQDVGHRLALWALAKTYGKKVEYSGPWYRSMNVNGDHIQLAFDHVDGGLVAKGGKLTGFAIAGADRKFVWANATIDGGQVIVSSPEVTEPVAVRYAWDINPICNLYNKAGLPAVPFRTDDWPMITNPSK